MIEEAGAGIAVGAGDDKHLAEAVLKLYHMPVEQRRAMGEKGRDYYDKHFEREMLVARLEQWMRDVAEEGLCES